MILAEKIMSLRKKNGWSQEELAEKLNISRQSVSKWEGAASIPDIDRIIAMSRLFGVSTDYLLKDDEEKELPSGTEDVYEAPKTRTVSVEEANAFMDLSRRLAGRIAGAIALLVLSPAPLILLGGLAEDERARVTVSEEMVAGIGVAILLVLVAIGVGILVLCGMRLEKYEYLERESIKLQYGVEGIVRKKKEEFTGRFRTCIVAGVVLCIIGAVPVVVSSAFSSSELAVVYCVDILLVLVSIAVFLFVWAGSIWGSFNKLLQEDDYTVEKKEMEKKLSFFSGAYWCLATAVFLAAGFYFERWKHAALIWPVAALLFVSIRAVIKEHIRSRREKEERIERAKSYDN